jgi:hypothetical protein
MHHLHFKYDFQAAILENQLRAITITITNYYSWTNGWINSKF